MICREEASRLQEFFFFFISFVSFVFLCSLIVYILISYKHRLKLGTSLTPPLCIEAWKVRDHVYVCYAHRCCLFLRFINCILGLFIQCGLQLIQLIGHWCRFFPVYHVLSDYATMNATICIAFHGN